jgi:hypothetical protein
MHFLVGGTYLRLGVGDLLVREAGRTRDRGRFVVRRRAEPAADRDAEGQERNRQRSKTLATATGARAWRTLSAREEEQMTPTAAETDSTRGDRISSSDRGSPLCPFRAGLRTLMSTCLWLSTSKRQTVEVAEIHSCATDLTLDSRSRGLTRDCR